MLRKRSVWILKNFSERVIEPNEGAGRRIKSKLVVFKQEIETRRFEIHKNHVLSSATVEGSELVVVDLPKKIVAQLGAKCFQFLNGIDVKQKFVYVLKLGGKFVRQEN